MGLDVSQKISQTPGSHCGVGGVKLVLPPDFFTDDHSFDTIMLGQKVNARAVEPVEDRTSWHAQQTALRALARHAVPQARALAWLTDERPDVLEDFQQRADSWLHTWLPA